MFIIDVLIAVATFFIELFEAIVEIGMNIVKTVVAIVMMWLEALFKAIILAFIYLMFALMISRAKKKNM